MYVNDDRVYRAICLQHEKESLSEKQSIKFLNDSKKQWKLLEKTDNVNRQNMVSFRLLEKKWNDYGSLNDKWLQSIIGGRRK